MYQPIAEAVLQAKLRIVATNLPLATARKMTRDGLAARGRSPIFTKRTESVRSGDSGSQIVSDRVLGADERSLGRAVPPRE